MSQETCGPDLVEDSGLVPFWLKGPDINSHHRGGMSDGVVVWTGEPTGDWDTGLFLVLFCFWATTFLLGVIFGWCCRCPSQRQTSPAVAPTIAAWENPTRRDCV